MSTADKGDATRTPESGAPADGAARSREWLPRILAWLVVLVPSAWGVGQVVLKSTALFR